MENDIAGRVIVRELGLLPYTDVWQKMKRFTTERDESTLDEIWVLQHEPVFTLGQAGKDCHLLNTDNIPVVKSDRGGQVTYHGPGQLIAYLLLDLKRRHLGVKKFVTEVEGALIDMLAELGIQGLRREKAPGVYVSGKKIGSLGLRVHKNCTYHGLSLNMDMDLSPFSRINVCGYPGLEVTQICSLVANVTESKVKELLQKHLIERLGYSSCAIRQGWS